MALSKKQNKRLGAILSVMFKEETPSGAIDEVVGLGFVEETETGYKITTKGLDEKIGFVLWQVLISNTLRNAKVQSILKIRLGNLLRKKSSKTAKARCRSKGCSLYISLSIVFM